MNGCQNPGRHLITSKAAHCEWKPQGEKRGRDGCVCVSLPSLPLKRLTVLPSSPWGGYSWGPSRILVRGQRHMIKEEKSRNWGQGCIFNAGIQSTEIQYQSTIFQYPQRRGWRHWDRILTEGLQTGNRETGRGCICLPFKWVSLRVLPAPKNWVQVVF